jgi:hypothetical protein
MAKSATAKKSKIKYRASKQEQESMGHAVDLAVQYVNQWKLHEITRMIQRKAPVCIPVGDRGYVVGHHVVIPTTEGTWDLHGYSRGKINNFSSPGAALAYSMCDQSGRIKIAQEIMESDRLVQKYQENLARGKYRLAQARARNDIWRMDFFTTLTQESQLYLTDARNQLQKNLKQTKYMINFGTNHES